MPRRLISSSRSEIMHMTAAQLKESILASEGRTILCQNFVGSHPLCEGTTNTELNQAMGADMIFFNGYSMSLDHSHPGLIVEEWVEGKGYSYKEYRLKDMKKLIDIPMGIYLECGGGDDAATSTNPSVQIVRQDRVSSRENLERLIAEEADFVVLGGNPGTKTTGSRIVDATKLAKEVISDKALIFSGKWEDGVYDKVLGDPEVPDKQHKEFISALIDAGADVICLPMPGSRTAIDINCIRDLVTFTHTYKPGTLVMAFLDGSVEGADTDTVRQCSLWSKITGADIHAIGDAGLSGMSVPENIYQMSIAIKGRRLTFRRLAGTRR